MSDPMLSRIEPREPENLPYGEVAICTPVYRAYKYFDQYFKSLYNLDYPKEHIHLRWAVSGKDDPTLEMVRAYIDSFGYLYASAKYKYVKQNRGSPHQQVRNLVIARRVIVDMCKGLDIMFLDSDMFMPPHALTALRNDTSLGASIVGGINPFWFRDTFNGQERRRITLPIFTLEGNKSTLFAMHGTDSDVWIGNKLLGKRLWVDAVGGGIFYIKKEVHEQIEFKTPLNELMSDDVTFCFDAVRAGFKVMSDFNVYCQHWGYNMFKVGQDAERTYFHMDVAPEMMGERRKRRREKSY
jgi:glycosyltransferase involved in cell wall biosynthesis